MITGVRNGATLFVLTHHAGSPTFGADVILAREPQGALSRNGFLGTVWHVQEVVPGEEDSPGVWKQWEIHRLWPLDHPMLDVIWLTDYSGATGDTLTGYPIEPGDDFLLHDEITLELNQLDQVGLHGDCRVREDQIAAALVSFDGPVPKPLLVWIIDYDSATFIELSDLDGLRFGDCFKPEPRS